MIEIPKGSRNKYELDGETGAIKLDRLLFLGALSDGLRLFPDTWALGDDPLDAVVCVSEPTFPGCHRGQPIAPSFRMRDERRHRRQGSLRAADRSRLELAQVLEDIPQGLRDEIAHFFSIYKNLERKQVEVDGWYSREDALAEIGLRGLASRSGKRCTARPDLAASRGKASAR